MLTLKMTVHFGRHWVISVKYNWVSWILDKDQIPSMYSGNISSMILFPNIAYVQVKHAGFQSYMLLSFRFQVTLSEAL